MKKPFVGCIAALALLGGCVPSTGSDLQRGPGIIESPYLHAAPLSAPDSVTAGQTFDVTVTTLGFSGCWQADGASVTTQPTGAAIAPFDRVIDAVCTQALVDLPRTIKLRFDTPGTVTVAVVGVSDNNGQQARARVEKTLIVR